MSDGGRHFTEGNDGMMVPEPRDPFGRLRVSISVTGKRDEYAGDECVGAFAGSGSVRRAGGSGA